jgi:hypothetical protein
MLNLIFISMKKAGGDESFVTVEKGASYQRI